MYDEIREEMSLIATTRGMHWISSTQRLDGIDSNPLRELHQSIALKQLWNSHSIYGKFNGISYEKSVTWLKGKLQITYQYLMWDYGRLKLMNEWQLTCKYSPYNIPPLGMTREAPALKSIENSLSTPLWLTESLKNTNQLLLFNLKSCCFINFFLKEEIDVKRRKLSRDKKLRKKHSKL